MICIENVYNYYSIDIHAIHFENWIKYWSSKIRFPSFQRQENLMVTIHKINTSEKSQVRRFVHVPYRLYNNHPQWVPPLYMDAETQLNREKHPYYEHSDADFFVAERNGEDSRLAFIYAVSRLIKLYR